MTSLNFKHLRYFWMVAKTGSIAQAAAQLHLTPQSISGQLTEFAATLGVELFRRSGRNLELTESGRRMVSYADEIFSIGDEMMDALRDQAIKKPMLFRVGIADSVSKLVAYRLVKPAFSIDEPLRLICREGRLNALLADLAVHRLDLIIADRAMPSHLNVRGYSHLLGESGLSIFGAASLAKHWPGEFPNLLDGAPFLLPGEDVAIKPKLVNWLEANNLRPHIVGEFDDSALMQSFGQGGAGLFAGPTAIAQHICSQYKVKSIGRIDAVVEQLYAITTERRLKHPAVVAIREAAHKDLFAEVSTQ